MEQVFFEIYLFIYYRASIMVFGKKETGKKTVIKHLTQNWKQVSTSKTANLLETSTFQFKDRVSKNNKKSKTKVP
jgi:hypothetical protein